MTLIISDNLERKETYPSPSLGSSHISKEEVSLAIDALISRMGIAFIELVVQTSDKTYSSTDFGSVTLYSSENEQLVGKKYTISAHVEVKDLKDNDHLDHLLIKLSKKLSELGYHKNPGIFEIRFEKGILETSATQHTSWWHRDYVFTTAITTCFSNKENWSTQVANEKKMLKEKIGVVNEFWNASRKGTGMKIPKGEFEEILESVREPTQQGHLYDALNVYHRAPRLSDLGDQEIGPDDYRLFIRYTE